MSKSKQSSQTVIDVTSLKFWAAAIKELGIPAFLVLFSTVIFLYYSTLGQKREFIDRFFLLKKPSEDPFPFSFVILVALLIIITQHVYYNKIIDSKDQENKRLGKEKSNLQEKLLNRNLNSSQEKK